MQRWKKASYLCLPVLALGVSVWAAPRQQDKDTAPKQETSKQETPGDDTIPAVPEAQGIQKDLQKIKAKPGKVSCCIRPACDFCVSHFAMCQCGKNLANHKPVCRECKGGWAAGDGHMDHISPEDVQVMTTAQVIKDIKGSPKTSKTGKTSVQKGTKKPDTSK